MRVDGDKRLRVHRLVWILAHGPIPKATVVRQLCGNRMCINVEHLGLATNFKPIGRPQRSLLASGVVDEIRRRHGEGGISQRQLAREYGEHPMTVNRIVNDRTSAKVRAMDWSA